MGGNGTLHVSLTSETSFLNGIGMHHGLLYPYRSGIYCYPEGPQSRETQTSIPVSIMGTQKKQVRGQLPAAHRILMTLRIDLSRTTS